MKYLSTHLDRIANDLESMGLSRLARDLDTVTNSIAKTAAQSFDGSTPLERFLTPLRKSEVDFTKSLESVQAEAQKRGVTVWFRTSGLPEAEKVEETVLRYLAWHNLQSPVPDRVWEFLHTFLFDPNLKIENKKQKLLWMMGTNKYSPAALTGEMDRVDAQAVKNEERGVTRKEFAELNNYRVVHKFPDGWAWTIPLNEDGSDKGGCPTIGKIQGHCGNGQGITGDTLWVLRKESPGQLPDVGASVAINNGKIRESKGAFNKKIDLDKHGDKILWLLRQEHVKGFNDRGAYRPEANTHMSDLLSNKLHGASAEQLVSDKPSVANNSHDNFVIKWRPWFQQQTDKKAALTQLKGMFPLKAKLSQIRATTGIQEPFSEQELVNQAHHLNILELMTDAGAKILTPALQEAFSKNNKDLSDMIFMAATGVQEIEVPKLATWVHNARGFSLGRYDGAVGGEIHAKIEQFLEDTPDLAHEIYEKTLSILQDPSPEDEVDEDEDEDGNPVAAPLPSWNTLTPGFTKNMVDKLINDPRTLDTLVAQVLSVTGRKNALRDIPEVLTKKVETDPRVLPGLQHLLKHSHNNWDHVTQGLPTQLIKNLEQDPQTLEVLKDKMVEGKTNWLETVAGVPDGLIEKLAQTKEAASAAVRDYVSAWKNPYSWDTADQYGSRNITRFPKPLREAIARSPLSAEYLVKLIMSGLPWEKVTDKLPPELFEKVASDDRVVSIRIQALKEGKLPTGKALLGISPDKKEQLTKDPEVLQLLTSRTVEELKEGTTEFSRIMDNVPENAKNRIAQNPQVQDILANNLKNGEKWEQTLKGVPTDVAQALSDREDVLDGLSKYVIGYKPPYPGAPGYGAFKGLRKYLPEEILRKLMARPEVRDMFVKSVANNLWASETEGMPEDIKAYMANAPEVLEGNIKTLLSGNNWRNAWENVTSDMPRELLELIKTDSRVQHLVPPNQAQRTSTMSKLAITLDTIAAELEAKGLRKLAFDLDTVANALEATAQDNLFGVPIKGIPTDGITEDNIHEAGYAPSPFRQELVGVIYSGSNTKRDGAKRQWENVKGTGTYYYAPDKSLMIEVREGAENRHLNISSYTGTATRADDVVHYVNGKKQNAEGPKERLAARPAHSDEVLQLRETLKSVSTAYGSVSTAYERVHRTLTMLSRTKPVESLKNPSNPVSYNSLNKELERLGGTLVELAHRLNTQYTQYTPLAHKAIQEAEQNGESPLHKTIGL